MKSLLIICCFVCVFISLADAEVNYSKRANTLSVKADGQSLTDILNEIKEKTGIRVDNAEGVEGSVYEDFNNLTLEKGLRRLLKTKNYSFTYSGNSIKKISILPGGSQTRQ